MSKKPFFLLIAIVLALITVYQISLNFQTEHYWTRLAKVETKLIYISDPKNTTGNIPNIYFTSTKTPKGINETCALWPNLFDLRIKNDNWQIQKTINGTFHLFNAYLDRRNGSSVRIVGTYSQKQPEELFFCQLWYSDRPKPEIVQTVKLFWLFSVKWGADTKQFDHPYIITCPLMDNEVPLSVSLIGEPCDNATNNLMVFSKEVEKKKDFVVCVKGLSFPFEDNSARLAEWIELVNILGAEKINFYDFRVHPNSQRILDYYSALGKIEVTPLTLVGDVSNSPFLQNHYLHKKTVERRLQEVIPYNDCLYKHLQEFRFVILLDTDEVIVPLENTWMELMESLQELNPNKSSYIARNIYFLDTHMHQHNWFEEFPKYMHMLQHVYRAQNYTKPGHFVKGFHDTQRVFGLHNHYPFACLGRCNVSNIDENVAHLQHYRGSCVKEIGNCQDMTVNDILDTRVWHFKDELIKRVRKTFQDLKMDVK